MTTVSVILIKTKTDYEAAKARVRTLMTAPDANTNADELQAQARLVEAYERHHFPIPDPDPVDAILFRMEQEGMDRRALSALLGASTGRISEILNGQRALSIGMIRTLHRKLGIPGDILIGTSKARRSAATRTSSAGGHRAQSPRK